MTVGILGGGISGLSLASFLKTDYEILEKEASCGGLCTTHEKNGFLYDTGGHIIFSSHQDILDYEVSLLGDNVHKNRRNNKIWYKERFVKYPFENGLNALEKEEVFECLRDYLKNNFPKPTNLEEWFYFTFGKSISEKYLLPYNKKIWKTEPSLMSMGWVERIPKPPIEDILKSSIGIETEGYTHQLFFHYPTYGGFQSLIRAFESKLTNIKTSVEIKSISKEKNTWIVETSEMKHSYNSLVSTIPLFNLVNLMNIDIPIDVRNAIKDLRYNSMAIVLIGLNKIKHKDLTAIYVPDASSLAHRYCFSSGFSPNLSPKGCSSIFAEITFNSNLPKEDFINSKTIDSTINWLVKERFIEKSDVCETDIKYIKYAYPVYDIDYDKKMKIIYDFFNKIQLHLLGRFSQFIYMNSDVCIYHARELANKINCC